MHEVELVREVLARVPTADQDPPSFVGRSSMRSPQRRMSHRELVDVVVHATLDALGIEIRPDGTLVQWVKVTRIDGTE